MNKNVIIVDDEESGANVLRLLILKYFPNLNIQTTCHNIVDAEKAIKAFLPDIVFLDIRMPEGNGLELLDSFENINFAVIFVTAFDEYALRALKLRAVDYLLKPANKIDLEVAINKAIELLPVIRKNEYYYPKLNKRENFLILNKYKNTYIYLQDIAYITAFSNYTIICDIKLKQHITSKTLKNMEEILCFDDSDFLRIHKSVIINIQHINYYTPKGENLVIIMNDNKEFEVAQRKRIEIFNILRTKAT